MPSQGGRNLILCGPCHQFVSSLTMISELCVFKVELKRLNQLIFVLFWICVQPGSLRLKINVLNTSAFCPLVRGKTNTNCHGRTTFFFNHFMILLCQF